jgi:hypothetical protein
VKKKRMEVNEWVSLCLATLLVGYLGIRVLNTKERLKPFRHNTLRLEDAMFQTGDLLLFHSNLLLMLVMDSPFSHVGMVVVIGETPYLFEIVPNNQVCTMTPVNRYFINANRVYYRPIDTALDWCVVMGYLREVADRVYDYSAWVPMIHRAFGHLVFPRLPKRKATKAFSCATLIGTLLHRFGVLAHKTDFVPEDFSSLRYVGRWGVETRLM